MCGIAGILRNRPSGGPEALAAVRPMLHAMTHRGPDDEGVVWCRGGAGAPVVSGGPGAEPAAPPADGVLALGHRRLSILDLSPAGHQPMATEDGRYWIVYNGEVYNYADVRAELKAAGEGFRSNTDTEVVLKAFRRWGADCLERFNGMFAFAIWDDREKRLFCARDRIGIKPFYYVQTADAFLFASDIKTLIASGLYRPEPDWEGLYHGMSFLAAPRPMTAFAGVRALRQGHWLRIGPDAAPEERPWWRLELDAVDEAATEAQWVERLDGALDAAVGRRLVADVEVATFLSGGVDSTTVTALAARRQPGIRAFTLGMDDPTSPMDEVAEAAATAGRYPITHVIERARPEALLDHLDDVVRAFEEPFISLPPIDLICRLVASHGIKVALSGLGGDELFCGYGRERWLRLWPLMRAARLAAPLMERAGRRGARLAELSRARTLSDAYLAEFSFFGEAHKRRLFGPAAADWSSPDRLRELYGLDGVRFRDPIQAISYLDLVNYVGNHFVYRVDQFSMQVGLEARLPLLDHELVELAFRIPSRFKVRRGERKYILRRVAERYVDPASLRMAKRGFSLPMDRWMRGQLRPLVESKLAALGRRPAFDAAVVDATYAAFRAGRASYAQVWQLVSTELWLEAFWPG